MTDTKYLASHKNENGEYTTAGMNYRTPLSGITTLKGAINRTHKMAEHRPALKDRDFKIEDFKTGKMLHEHQAAHWGDGKGNPNGDVK